MTNERQSFVEEMAQYYAEAARETNVRVMVLGPSLVDGSPSATLRRFIIGQCNDRHVTLTGEHEGLLTAYEQVTGPKSNLCTHELTIANRSHAIVIIPDSPGSFIELGMFVWYPDICSKTLVLVDNRYDIKNSRTFLALGPLRAYLEQRGTVISVNYEDTITVWTTVNEFLDSFRRRELNQNLIKRATHDRK